MRYCPMRDSATFKIFISYAHEDRAYCDELLNHIGWLRNSGRIEAFDDRSIRPSEKWNSRIQGELANADIVVLPVSPNFIGSSYCSLHEMIPAINNGSKIFTVLLRPIDFDSLPLSEFQALPKDNQQNLKPIASWRGTAARDSAWAQVAKSIREEIRQLEDQRPKRLATKSDRLEASQNHVPKQLIKSDSALRDRGLIGSVKYNFLYPKEALEYDGLRTLIDKTIMPLRQEAHEMEQVASENGLSKENYMINAEFKVVVKTDRVISVKSMSQSYLGGAHSNYQYIALNYDILNGTDIRLVDLISNQRELEQLWPIVIRRLMYEKRARGASVDLGMDSDYAPFPLNDIMYTFLPKVSVKGRIGGINLLFSHYQLGSFAEGPYEIQLLDSEIYEFISSKFLNLF